MLLLKIVVARDGTSIPGKSLQPDFETGDYMKFYMTLFSGMRSVYQDKGNHIDRDKYT